MSQVFETASNSCSTEFCRDVIAGLSASARWLPSKYFYDPRGSALFDDICRLDEYYPTRVETDIMRRRAAEIAHQVGARVQLIEYGSGSSWKTRVLLDHLADLSRYVPVDICGQHLKQTAADLGKLYPSLEISPVVADFTQPLNFPELCHNIEAGHGTEAVDGDGARNCVYFPGSTIGNFERSQAIALLKKIALESRPRDGLLIGFDLQKEHHILEAAYNDRQGVTAAFNLNLLHRINRELGANFNVEQFEHHAFYNEAAERIEMHLVSQCEQVVSICNQSFVFGWGETICTEYSHKYTLDSFTGMAALAGWQRQKVWTDDREYFAVMYLKR